MIGLALLEQGREDHHASAGHHWVTALQTRAGMIGRRGGVVMTYCKRVQQLG